MAACILSETTRPVICKNGFMEELPVETIASDGNFYIFPLKFHRHCTGKLLILSCIWGCVTNNCGFWI
jgi:hypothetical protein